MQTAVEFLLSHMWTTDWVNYTREQKLNVIQQAKEMENNRATEYAEFCIRCDRAGLPLVQFEDWLDGLTFKSE